MIPTIVHALGSTAVAFATARYFYLFFSRTNEFVLWDRAPLREDRKRKALRYLYLTGAAFGIGFCIYRGALSALSWMPRAWTVVSDDGDSTWAAYGIAATLAVLGTVFLLENMSKRADRFVSLERYLEEHSRK